MFSMSSYKKAEEELSRQAELLRDITDSLDIFRDNGERAQKVSLSRFHYQRVFRRSVGESPHQLHRRLLLERAAYDLRATTKGITVIGLEADYASAEGFCRAFRRAFGLSPRSYRQAARQIRLLPGSSGIHYNPPAKDRTSGFTKGKRNMDLIDRLFESDYTTKRRILECARLLSDAQLDAPLVFRHNLAPWAEPAKTLRESLGFISGGGWIDQMFQAVGWVPEDDSYRRIEGTTPDAVIAHFESFARTYHLFVAHVRRENRWDEEWIDDTCAQPETFAIGRVIEETLTWGIAYRSVLERQMEQMGFQLHEIPVDKIKETKRP